jgi:hypothetical protein
MICDSIFHNVCWVMMIKYEADLKLVEYLTFSIHMVSLPTPTVL